jgi:hypothetical protein
MRIWTFKLIAASALLPLWAAGCAKPEYPASTPDDALASMYQMIADGRPEMLSTLVHIQPRDITFADGVTEASAIQNVIDKLGDMFGRLYRVAKKLNDQFPKGVQAELAAAAKKDQQNRGDDLFARFLIDPFGLIDQERRRVSVEDLGDGTAAVLVDGKPALGLGLQMRDVNGTWKIDVPIELLQSYRPNTREEWSVLASMILSIEQALISFEQELDRGEFRDLRHASRRAGRLFGERAVVQALIYQAMKDRPAPQPG